MLRRWTFTWEIRKWGCFKKEEEEKEERNKTGPHPVYYTLAVVYTWLLYLVTCGRKWRFQIRQDNVSFLKDPMARFRGGGHENPRAWVRAAGVCREMRFWGKRGEDARARDRAGPARPEKTVEKRKKKREGGRSKFRARAAH